MKPKRVAIYTRVSTSDQNPQLQKDELLAYCEFRKWVVTEIYSDTISGAKDKRPALDRLMADAKRGKFDVLAVWRFDRFARSTRFLLEALETFNGLGIDFASLQESVDTSTSTGKAIFTILGAVAELERSTIRERVLAGQKAAKRRGVKFGRPTVDVDTAKVRQLRQRGMSWREMAAEMGIPKDTLRRSLEGQGCIGVGVAISRADGSKLPQSAV